MLKNAEKTPEMIQFKMYITLIVTTKVTSK